YYSALEALLRDQVFTDGGRAYVVGDRKARCNYAYLEKPQVGAHKAQLRVRAHFDSLTALELGGDCVGPVQAFDVSMTGVPVYRDGVLRLEQTQLEPADGLYGGLIRAVLGDALEQSLQYPLLQDLQRFARKASMQSPYEVRMRDLDVHTIRVEAEAIILMFDFSMEVR
ncbi:MAG: hypothetical protein V3T12_02280, partial [Acidiferrobacterales bacterium]